MVNRKNCLCLLNSVILFFLFLSRVSASLSDTLVRNQYDDGYHQLQEILKVNGSFKKAVFIVENTYYQNELSKEIFATDVVNNESIARTIFTRSFTLKYKNLDSSNYLLNYAILKTFTDTIFTSQGRQALIHIPFTYSFADPLGKQDWSKMFVTKLLATHKGNCHSLAYLYKILADELGAKCWLALAPSHIYIRNYSDKTGWYNTELTSGTCPTDAWIMTTGYVSPTAIKSGLYMDTLSNQQAIALCVLDLARGYEFQTHNYYDGFIVKCCDLVLQYHPINPMALLLKAETLKKVYLKETIGKYPKLTVTRSEMEQAYIILAKSGYREMPDKMYQQWLQSMIIEKDKYSNKKVMAPTQRH